MATVWISGGCPVCRVGTRAATERRLKTATQRELRHKGAILSGLSLRQTPGCR